MTERVTDEMLMAFVDGEADEATVAVIEQVLARDAHLAARARMFRASRAVMREAFGDARREPVPPTLVEAVRGADRKGTVVAFPSRSALRFALPLAASLAVAFGFAGYLLGQAGGGTTDPMGRVAIAGALAGTKAGESRPVTISGDEALLRSLATYRIDGGLCRSFDLSGADIALSGVGCDRGAGWDLDLTVARAAGDGSYAPASEAALSSIDAYLDTIEASPPLTADEEAALPPQ